MSIKTTLSELVKEGAVLNVHGIGEFGIAAAELRKDQERDQLRWVGFDPVDNSDIHHLVYDSIKEDVGHLVFYKDGDFVGGLGPAVDFGLPDFDLDFARHKSKIESPKLRERFEDFFDHA